MKITDPTIVKNHEGEYFVKNSLDHNELDIICEGLTHMINAGLSDPVRRADTLKLYGELYSMWEATTFDNSRPVPPQMIKKDITLHECPKGSEWNEKAEDCVPIAGYFKDETGEIKVIPVSDCGNNAHFDSELGCVCNKGFVRDKVTGECVSEVIQPAPK